MAVAKWKLFMAKVIILGIKPWFPALLDEEFDDFILLAGLVLLLVATPTKLFAVSWAVAKVESFVVSAWSSWGRFFEACFCERVSCKTSGSLAETSLSKGKSTALILNKAPSTSNVRGSFKWSKPSVTVTNLTGRRKSVKKPKLAKSKLKWTKPGIHTQTRLKPQVNPYVLRKGNLSSENKTQKEGIASSTAVTIYKMAKKTVNSKSNEVCFLLVLNMKSREEDAGELSQIIYYVMLITLL